MDKAKFRSECLQAHNACRKVHGAEPLELLKELNDYAQNWAEHMASTSNFAHSRGRYGENIAYRMQSKNPTGEQITKMWYNEEQNYDYATQKSKTKGKAIGHFTQVVWKGTLNAGFGIASYGDRKFYAVGSYKDRGNITNAGYYAKNVGRKTGEPDYENTDDSAPKEGEEEAEEAVPADSGDESSDDAAGEKSVSEESADEDDKAAEKQSKEKKPRNKLVRPVMKAFRKSFMDQMNQYREEIGTPRLTKDRVFQKLAEKCSKKKIRGKEAKDDDVPEKLNWTLPSLPTGNQAVEDVKKGADESDENSKNMFDVLMSKDVRAVGVGVACPEADGHDCAYITVYLR